MAAPNVDDPAVSHVALPSGLDQLGAEPFLAVLVRSSDDAIIGKTPGGQVVFWNVAASNDRVGVRAEQQEESAHGILDSCAVACCEQVEQEAGDDGDRERGENVVVGGKRFIEPVVDRMFEEVRVAVGVTKREPVRFEEEPQQRCLVGVRHPVPHHSKPRTAALRFRRSPNGPQSIPHATQDLCDELLLRAEVMEKDRSLRTDRSGQGSQRQIGDAVGHDVVDRTIEQLLATLWIERSGHV